MHYDKEVVVVQQAKASKLIVNLHTDTKTCPDFWSFHSEPSLFHTFTNIVRNIHKSQTKKKRKKKNTHLNAFSYNKHKS